MIEQHLTVSQVTNYIREILGLQLGGVIVPVRNPGWDEPEAHYLIEADLTLRR